MLFGQNETQNITELGRKIFIKIVNKLCAHSFEKVAFCNECLDTHFMPFKLSPFSPKL